MTKENLLKFLIGAFIAIAIIIPSYSTMLIWWQSYYHNKQVLQEQKQAANAKLVTQIHVVTDQAQTIYNLCKSRHSMDAKVFKQKLDTNIAKNLQASLNNLVMTNILAYAQHNTSQAVFDAVGKFTHYVNHNMYEPYEQGEAVCSYPLQTHEQITQNYIMPIMLAMRTSK